MTKKQNNNLKHDINAKYKHDVKSSPLTYINTYIQCIYIQTFTYIHIYVYACGLMFKTHIIYKSKLLSKNK